MSSTQQIIEDTEKYMVRNYERIPVVQVTGMGSWIWDSEGNQYLDMLSTYSAENFGHFHPRIADVAMQQIRKLTTMPGCFYNDKTAELAKKLCKLTGMPKVMFKNSGAEGVEAAMKISRKWGYKVKGIDEGKDDAEIIVCSENFHGRTYGPISVSSVAHYRDGFGPFLPGITWIPFGDADALGWAIKPNTAAFLLEPIQGEGGINVPPEGYLKEVKSICRQNNVLLVLDEVQTGFGRTGNNFAFQYDNIKPDILILGKALGGGIVPISAVLGRRDVMNVIGPGDDGSTFGGNPFASAIACEAIAVLTEEKLAQRALWLGNYFIAGLKEIKHPAIKEVRGRGLLVGLELFENIVGAKYFVAEMAKNKVLCKDTHGNVVRFSPPLIISIEELEWGIEVIKKVLGGIS